MEMECKINTLQEINISHLGKKKIIFKMPFLGGYVSFLEGKIDSHELCNTEHNTRICLSECHCMKVYISLRSEVLPDWDGSSLMAQI